MSPSKRAWIGTGVALLAAAVVVGDAWGGDEAPSAADHPVRTAVWTEGEGAQQTLVIALYRADAAQRRQTPEKRIAIGIALDSEKVRPDYGTLHVADWRHVDVALGELVQARVALRGRGAASVLVATEPAESDVDVHELIHGDLPPGAFAFHRVHSGGPVHVDRHVLAVGEKATLRIDAPDEDGFFRDETFEIVRVARRLAIDGDDPDAAAGCVTVTPKDIAADDLVLLEGEAGEKRIRAHFEKPTCEWAERHVGWTKDHFVFAYQRPAALTLTLDTSTVKTAPGLATGHWKGWGALCWESIWPNGFGGSSSNLSLPAILVVPKDTPTRDLPIDR